MNSNFHWTAKKKTYKKLMMNEQRDEFSFWKKIRFWVKVWRYNSIYLSKASVQFQDMLFNGLAVIAIFKWGLTFSV